MFIGRTMQFTLNLSEKLLVCRNYMSKHFIVPHSVKLVVFEFCSSFRFCFFFVKHDFKSWKRCKNNFYKLIFSPNDHWLIYTIYASFLRLKGLANKWWLSVIVIICINLSCSIKSNDNTISIIIMLNLIINIGKSVESMGGKFCEAKAFSLQCRNTSTH